MNTYNLYNDIQARTNGEIYLGVVGPIRTGKSTFIKRFMENYVIPYMSNENERTRAIDELPVSAAGTAVMTTEPKFIPNTAANILLANNLSLKVRLIDCVGYMIDTGDNTDSDNERLVKTPWQTTEIPFSKAAKIGTQKVINEHSTIGIVITTDGSIGDIPREKYINAEEETINALKQINKPFVIILNTTMPNSSKTKALIESLEKKYNVSVLPINCDQLTTEDIENILQAALMEFPVCEFRLFTPEWMQLLPPDHALRNSTIELAKYFLENFSSLKDIINFNNSYSPENFNSDYFENININEIDTATGNISINVTMRSEIYYATISELTKTNIQNEYDLIYILKKLSAKKEEFANINKAIENMNTSGFSIITPLKESIHLETPTVIKNGSRYGVLIKANAPAINLLRTSINIEIAPIVGSKQQAEDLIEYINQNSKEDATGIWDTNIFGKNIEQIVTEQIEEKISNITASNMNKITETLEKVTNENSGLVCLIV